MTSFLLITANQEKVDRDQADEFFNKIVLP